MRPYRPLSVHDTHFIGPNGRPAHNATSITLLAVDAYDTYYYMFDTSVAEVTVRDVVGGTARPAYVNDEGITVVEIAVPPQQPGDEYVLSFETEFRYQTDPPREFRRYTGEGGFREWDVVVSFNHDQVPAEVHRAVWTGYGPDATIVPDSAERLWLEQAEPGDDASPHLVAYTFTDLPPGLTVGLTWSWNN